MLHSLLFYFILLFVCTIVSYLADKYNSKTILYFLISVFVFFTGFRGEEVGIDTVGYVETWNEALYGHLLFTELGFQFLIYFLQIFTDNEVFLFLTCSLIIYVLIILRLWDFRNIASFPIMILALYMLVFMQSMNIMRQFCGVAIVFYFTRYLFNRQYIRYLLGLIIATSFHTSSILGLSLFGLEILNWKRFSKKRKMIFILLLLLVSIVGCLIFKIVYTKYGHYFIDTEVNVGVLTFVKFIFIIISYYLSKISCKAIAFEKNGYYINSFVINAVVLLYLLGVIVESLGYFFPFMNRVGLIYSFWGIIFWGILFKMTRRIQLKCIYLVSMAVLLGVPFLLAIIFNGFGTVPYFLCW